MYIILYIYKEYNKSIRKGGKRVKSCGKVYSSLYIEYIIKSKQRKGKKGAGQKVSAGKSVSLI